MSASSLRAWAGRLMVRAIRKGIDTMRPVPIRTFDDPVLSMTCQPVTDPVLLELVSGHLLATFAQVNTPKKTAVGLAAPQIGLLWRVIVIAPGKWDKPLVLVNPTLLEHSEIVQAEEEGCLSYPGIRRMVPRWFSVTLRYGTLDGGLQTKLFTGFPARVLQHEMDHLDGVCRVGTEWHGERIERRSSP